MTKTDEMSNKAAENFQSIADSSQYVLASGIQGAFTDIIDGSKNVADAFSDMTLSILRDIERLLLFELVAKPLASAVLGAIGGAGGGGAPAAPKLIMAQHGIVTDRPTVAMFGEAGPEAVMPLVRTPSGDLGVRSEGGGQQVNIFINTTAFDDVSMSKWWQKNQGNIVAAISAACQRGNRPLRTVMRTTLSG